MPRRWLLAQPKGKTGTMTVTNKVLRHTGKLTVKKVLTGETSGYVGTGRSSRSRLHLQQEVAQPKRHHW
ncbi:MAG: hypothetical protein R2693_02575 [Nocardioidaceae bacterium]